MNTVEQGNYAATQAMQETYHDTCPQLTRRIELDLGPTWSAEEAVRKHHIRRHHSNVTS